MCVKSGQNGVLPVVTHARVKSSGKLKIDFSPDPSFFCFHAVDVLYQSSLVLLDLPKQAENEHSLDR